MIDIVIEIFITLNQCVEIKKYKNMFKYCKTTNKHLKPYLIFNIGMKSRTCKLTISLNTDFIVLAHPPTVYGITSISSLLHQNTGVFQKEKEKTLLLP